MMNRSRCVVLCRYANEIGSAEAIKVENLAEKLVNLGMDYSCIVTGGDERARVTADWINTRLTNTPTETEHRLDFISRDDGNAIYKIRMAVFKLLTYTRDCKTVIFVTNPLFIKLCSILFFGIKIHAFIPLAFTLPLRFPEASYFSETPLVSEWRYETPDAYEKSKAYVEEEVGWVDSKWRDKPSKMHGKSEIVYESKAWTVRTDVWKMDRQGSENKFEVLMAITRQRLDESEDGKEGFLRSIRDLTPEHIPALKELDKMYSDNKWVKYFQYPPFVWKLHLHIEPREHSHPPPRNAYLLEDVITLVQSGPCKNLLVHVPLTHGSASRPGPYSAL